MIKAIIDTSVFIAAILSQSQNTPPLWKRRDKARSRCDKSSPLH